MSTAPGWRFLRSPVVVLGVSCCGCCALHGPVTALFGMQTFGSVYWFSAPEPKPIPKVLSKSSRDRAVREGEISEEAEV